jgi:hypothetical protein
MAAKAGDAEVSGKNYVGFLGLADLRGVDGDGTLLIDPTRVDIVTGNGSIVPADQVFNEARQRQQRSDGTESSPNWVLETSSLQLTARASGGNSAGDPDITIVNGFTYTSANSLALLAHDNIDILNGSDVVNLGTGNITLFAGWDGNIATVNTPGFNGGAYTNNDIDFKEGGSVITGGTLNLFAEKQCYPGGKTQSRAART